ncbi:hypothetical protein OROHE_016547 [Orobanche hederae]
MCRYCSSTNYNMFLYLKWCILEYIHLMSWRSVTLSLDLAGSPSY